MYWMGRCYERAGEFGNAHYLYDRTVTLANGSYYGQRAREAEAALQKSGSFPKNSVSGIDFKQVVEACNGIQFAPVALPEPDEAGARIIERARQLVSAGLQDLALSELRWGSRRYPRNEVPVAYVVSRIHLSMGDYYESIAFLRRAYPDYIGRPDTSLPDEIWQLLFPVRHWETISEQAGKAKLDPTLILGIIRQESAFEEKARSRANARGLMQILPSTGRALARQARVTRYTTTKLYQAQTNITLGTRHLSYLLQQFGKLELALAAYNAGKSRVDRWLKEFGDEDMAQFVEQIPFSETRNYVKQVLGNKAHYDRLTSSSVSAKH
jgi:soluble lytic murein transglycosylase